MRIAIVAAGMLLSWPAAADDFDWRSPAKRAELIGAFDSMARNCNFVGFSAVPKQPDDVMEGKLHAYLLVASSADRVINHWVGMMEELIQFEDSLLSDASIQRSSDAVVAAVSDPDAYERAERLYIETAIAPARRMLAGCKRAAGDPFLGKYYVAGRGSLRPLQESARQTFAKNVAELRAEHGKNK